MKKTASTLIILLVSFSCFASVLSPYGAMKTSTVHFDIVYPEHCEETAVHIYEECEQIYSEITEMIGIDPQVRIPVIITDKYKVNNAFFTNYPNNTIVLYDNPSTNPSLSVFEDSIVSIFRHELTHALIYNIRGRFPAALSRIFGDIISVSSALYVDEFFSEGIAVYSESRNGSGRLNNSHVMEIIRQAKSDGSFPSWDVVNGSRDTYGRGNNSYIFGGAFMKYLAETYGEDKLFEYFIKAGDIHLFKLSHELFVSVFKISPKAAWKNFEDSIKVPDSIKENQSLKSDLFKSNQTFASTECSNNYFYTISSISNDICKIYPKAGIIEKTGFAPSYCNTLSISDEGYVLSNHNLMETDDMILLNSEGKKVLSFAPDARNGCFINNEDTLKALIYGADGQIEKLTLYRFENLDSEAEAIAEKSILLGYDTLVLSMDSTETGYVVLLIKDGLTRKIVFLDVETFEMKSFEVPDILINCISCIDGSEDIVLSYNNSNPAHPSFSRLGRINVSLASNSADIYLSPSDISGGVYTPVSDGEEVFYIARFTDGDSLCLSDLSYFSLKYSSSTDLTPFSPLEGAPVYTSDNLRSNSLKYNLMGNIGRGVIIPLGINTADNSVALGGTWITSDLTQSLTLLASSGYSFENKDIFLTTSVTESSLPVEITVDSGISISVEDIEDINYFVSGTASKVFTLNSNNQTVTLSDTATVKNSDYFDFSNTFKANYYNAKSLGTGYYDYTAHSLTLTASEESAAFSAYYKAQSLLPLPCTGALTYNLPFYITGQVLYEYEEEDIYLSMALGSTLFAWDIQDNLPYTLFYFRRMHLDASYQHIIRFSKNGSTATANVLDAELLFDFSPIIGSSASELNFKIGPKVRWNINRGSTEWSFIIQVE